MKGSQLYLISKISLDKIVCHVEGVELLQLDEGLEVVDLVEGDPQLLEGFPNGLNPCQALDQVFFFFQIFNSNFMAEQQLYR